MATQGGPATSVVVQSGGRVAGGPALPVAVVPASSQIEGGPATAVYVVTGGPVQGGPAVPVVAGGAGAQVEGSAAIPVYVVSGSLGADPSMAYTSKVVALAPIGYWPLAEAIGSTVVVDESGNGRNGVYKAAGEPILAQTGIGDGRTSALFDGSNDFANVYTAGLSGAFNSAEGTIAIWFKVSAAGVWTDATARRSMFLQVDVNNRIRFEKTTTNNQLAGVYIAGGTTSTVLFTTAGPAGWTHLALTWSKSADQMKFFVNGTQQGATQSGLGVWAGALSASGVTLGAATTAATQPTAGYLAHAAVWASVLTPTQIATLAVVP